MCFVGKMMYTHRTEGSIGGAMPYFEEVWTIFAVHLLLMV